MARAGGALLLCLACAAQAGAVRLPSAVADAATALADAWGQHTASLSHTASGGAPSLAEGCDLSDDATCLPESFDSRLHWFGCGLSVLDQARACLQSWGHGSALCSPF